MGSLCTSSFCQIAERWPWQLSGFTTGLRNLHLHQKKTKLKDLLLPVKGQIFCCVAVVVRAASKGGRLHEQTRLTLCGSGAGRVPRQQRGHAGSVPCCSKVEGNSGPQGCPGW